VLQRNFSEIQKITMCTIPLYVLVLLGSVHSSLAQQPKCFFTRAANAIVIDGQPCNVDCSSGCEGLQYSVENGGSLFLNCTGQKTCQGLSVTIDYQSMADIICTSDFACSGANFSNYGIVRLKSYGLNTVYLANLVLRNQTASASVWCDGCYGLRYEGVTVTRGSIRSEVFCTRADQGNCGFFGITGDICCRGVGCDYHEDFPKPC